MTRSGVRRTLRAASRPARVQPTGEPELLPPTNQAAGERSGRHDQRSALRIGLRGLVVAGFAGVVWLLTAGAAQAAPADPPAADAVGDLSVVTLVNGFGNGADERADDGRCSLSMAVTQGPGTDPVPEAPSTVGELLAPVGRATAVVPACTTAAQGTPIADLLPAQRAGVTADRGAHATTDRTAGAAAPGGAAGGASPARMGTPRGRPGAGDPPDILTGLVTPRGMTDAAAARPGLLAPLTTAVTPVVASLDVVLRPTGDVLHDLTAPLAGTLEPVGGTVADDDRPGDVPRPHAVTHRPASGAVAGGPTAAVVSGHVAASGSSTGANSVGWTAATQLRAAGEPDARAGGNLPDRTRPAPLRAHLGTGGTPVNGSGCPSDGGTSATVPCSVVGGMVAFHQLPMTTDVVVLRHDAEAPTVSPD